MKSTAKAFTLIEVLATLLLIAVVLPVTMKGIAQATRLASQSKRQIQASYLAKNKLTELVTSGDWQNSLKSGNFEDENADFDWELETSDGPLESTYELALTVHWGERETQATELTSLVYERVQE